MKKQSEYRTFFRQNCRMMDVDLRALVAMLVRGKRRMVCEFVNVEDVHYNDQTSMQKLFVNAGKTLSETTPTLNIHPA